MSDKRRFRLPRRKKKDEVTTADAPSEVVDAEDESAATTMADEAGTLVSDAKPRRSLFRRRRGSDAPVVGAGLMRPFNLAPQPPKVEKAPTIGVGKLVAAGFVLAGVAALTFLYLGATDGRDSAAAERDDLRELLERPAPAVGGAAPNANEDALFADQLFRETAIAGVLVDRVSWDRVLGSISRVSPDGTWFSSLATAEPDAEDPAAAPAADGAAADTDPTSATGEPVEAALPTVLVNGFADDHETLAVLIGRLSALRELEDVSLDSSGGTIIGETEVVQFSISASITPGRTS